MRTTRDTIYHLLFEIGIVFKFALSAVEVVLGIILYSVSTATVSSLLYSLTGNELSEAPRDAIWNLIAHEIANFLRTPQPFWAFLFLSHGLIKLFLAGGLIFKKLWAYPASAAVFTVFVIYQVWQMVYTPSASLAAITVFDIVLIGLIIHEYRRKRRRAL